MKTGGFENVSGSLFDDVLTGDGGANIVAGDLGNDSLSGGDGNDMLYGDGRIWVDNSGSVGGSGPIALFGQVDDGLASRKATRTSPRATTPSSAARATTTSTAAGATTR